MRLSKNAAAAGVTFETEEEGDGRSRSITTQDSSSMFQKAGTRIDGFNPNVSPSPHRNLQQRQDLIRAYTFKLDRIAPVRQTKNAQGVVVPSKQQPAPLAPPEPKDPYPPTTIRIFHEGGSEHQESRLNKLFREYNLLINLTFRNKDGNYDTPQILRAARAFGVRLLP